MLQNRKTSALLVAGLAAFAYYKYTRMTPEERTKLADNIKDKAKGFTDQVLPGGFSNIFGGAKSNKCFAEANSNGNV